MKGKKPLSLLMIAMFVLSGIAITSVGAVPYYTTPPPIGLWSNDKIISTKSDLTGTRFNITVSIHDVGGKDPQGRGMNEGLGSISFKLWYNTTLLNAVYTYLTPMSTAYLSDYGPLDPETMEYTPTSPINDTLGRIYWFAVVKTLANPFIGSAPVLIITFEIAMAPEQLTCPPGEDPNNYLNTVSCPLHFNETELWYIYPVAPYPTGEYTLDTHYGLGDGLYSYTREPMVVGAPEANFVWSPTYPYEGGTVTLTDTSDPGDPGPPTVYIESWKWTVENDTGEAVLTGPDDASVTTILAVKAGTVHVTLNVTNNLGFSDDVTKDIVILSPRGAIIDLYTSTNRFCGQQTPNIGTGPNEPCDALSPDVNVTLYAKVTWNGAPVNHVLVAFEVRWLTYIDWQQLQPEPEPIDECVLYRTAETDKYGIARIWFRVPNPCIGPMFGKWIAIATCKVQEVKIEDTMPFDVGYLVTILEGSVTVDKTEYIREKDWITVTVLAKNIAQIPKHVWFVATFYDDCDVPIGQKIVNVTIPAGVYCSPWLYELTMEDAILVPQYAYVGIGKVYVSAFTLLPKDCGVAYCPEKSTTFIIKYVA